MAKKTVVSGKKAPVTAKKPKVQGGKEQTIELLPPALTSSIKNEIESLMTGFSEVTDDVLTAIQRRRKIGAGIKNYGFIDKVSDLASSNPQFATFFDITDLKNAIRNIEECRDIVVLLQAFARMVSNAMLIYSDDAFSMALIYYSMVKEMSRHGDPTAMELFNALKPFFKRPKRSSAEPTEKEIERDLHALIKGKADGKIVVENERPKLTSGERKVVDEVRKGRAAVKETVEAELDE
jgi:hypothetical protein